LAERANAQPIEVQIAAQGREDRQRPLYMNDGGVIASEILLHESQLEQRVGDIGMPVTSVSLEQIEGLPTERPRQNRLTPFSKHRRARVKRSRAVRRIAGLRSPHRSASSLFPWAFGL
jgi:hypothetical protein